jgi:hypothetical protein
MPCRLALGHIDDRQRSAKDLAAVLPSALKSVLFRGSYQVNLNTTRVIVFLL